MRYVSKVDEKGRLSLPRAARDSVGWAKGERVSVLVEDGTLRVLSAREEAERLRGFLKDRHPSRNLADELIEERRQEAAREEARDSETSHA